jgi:hypothetical protein
MVRQACTAAAMPGLAIKSRQTGNRTDPGDLALGNSGRHSVAGWREVTYRRETSASWSLAGTLFRLGTGSPGEGRAGAGTGCPSGLVAARPGRRNPGVPRRETSKAAGVAGQAQRAAVDRQRAAAVAHQLGGRQAARAVPHHRFWPSFWDAIIVGPGELAAEYHRVRQAPRPGAQLATLPDLRTYGTPSRAALAWAVW